MGKTKAALKSIKLLSFDATRYLTDDLAVAEYMTAVLEIDDPYILLLARKDVAHGCETVVGAIPK